jgi:hypothetical protein
MTPALNLATASTADLLACYNALAASRGIPLLPKRWHGTRVELATKLALLRAGRVVPLKVVPTDDNGILEPDAQALRARQPQPIRDTVLHALAIVDHFKHRTTGEEISKRRAKKFDRAAILSVGLPYAEVVRRVRARCPQSKIKPAEVRWYAHMVRSRADKFEHGRLPDRRPHGMRGVKIKRRGVP